VQSLQQPDLGAGEVRVPQVDDQDDPILAGVVPGLVLEVVVEHQTLALGPPSRLAADPDRAVPGGNGDPEVAAQPEVGRSAVRGDVGPAPHP
jgi:hypothetical protein